MNQSDDERLIEMEMWIKFSSIENRNESINAILFSFQMAAGSIEHEGPEMGVGDFVLLSEISMDAFVRNLKIRCVFVALNQENRTMFDEV